MTFLPNQAPGLYRTGDIGVVAEWRDLSYDWPHVVTPLGVSVYAYLRDTYDTQRSMYPFLFNPQGPTKNQIQTKMGKKTGHAIQGPEHLLSIVGLLKVDVTYGASNDPERPRQTRVAYYQIGRLDHPVLDWPMLERVLDAVCIAIDKPLSTSADLRKKAQAALEALSQAGFLQKCDPEDLYWEFGAWPRLLPNLVADERWERLFTHLHGGEAMKTYRRQARAWVEYAQRKVERLAEENRATFDVIQAIQRRGRPGNPSGGSPMGGSLNDQLLHVLTAHYQISATEAVQLTPTASVANMSLESRQAVQLTPTASATPEQGSLQEAVHADHQNGTHESLDPDQLTLRSHDSGGLDQDHVLATHDVGFSIGIASRVNEIPNVESHLQDEELDTIRLDGIFWTRVNDILYGVIRRYPHSDGEKKAAERHFHRKGIPVGVVLAALRALMTLPPSHRPQSFGDAIKSPVFHACMQQAQLLLPARRSRNSSGRTWHEFRLAYRSAGLSGELRDIGLADYGMLQSLFERYPDDCWEVLSRIEHATKAVKLTPQYLKRAISNNQLDAARNVLGHSTDAAQDHIAMGPHVLSNRTLKVADPRLALLEREGIDTRILAEGMDLEYIQAWIDEANIREPTLKSRRRWLIWGLKQQMLPQNHPDLPPRPSSSSRSGHLSDIPSAPNNIVIDPQLQAWWRSALTHLRGMIEENDFNTWINPTSLVELKDQTALIAVPNTFAVDHVTGRLKDVIRQALSTVTGIGVVEVVAGIDSSLAQ